MNERIAERRRQREEFLARLYHEVDASVTLFVSAFDLADELGLDREEAARVVAYFEEKGLLKVDDHRAGVLRLTAAGVDEVEQRLLGDSG
jgi:DNA-binding MarR family transcriptional regulator